MKVQTVAVDEIERIGIDTNQAFTIKFDAKMAKILADGLYSDKIQSVIRELSCNAWDSHVEAGHANKPFEVHIPNTIEPWFSVKDYGIGLAHDQVISIYTCYGASTKTNSNEVIGQLGLGSKSPFSICNAFDVSSRKDGIENHYSMYKDEMGMPSVAHLGSKATTEPNGVTVKIPVRGEQRREFTDKAKDVFKWFPVKPIIIGVDGINVEKIDFAYDSKTWGIRKPVKDYYGHYRSHKPVALMGLVAYPLDPYSIPGLDDAHTTIMGLPLVLRFNIGDLEVAANREAIGYDERTCKNIKARVESMMSELGDKFEKEIGTAKTLWEAKSKFNDIFGHGSDYAREFRDAFGNRGLNWNGVVIKGSNHVVDPSDIYEIGGPNNLMPQVHAFTERYKSGRKHLDGKLMMSCTNDTVIIFNDLKLGGISRTKLYHKSNEHKKDVWLFGPSDKVDWNGIREALGNPEITFASTLPKPISTAADRTNMLVWRDIQNESSPKAWEQVSIDLDEGGYYVDLSGWDIQANGKTYTDLGWFIKQAKQANIIPQDTKVYAMRASNKKIVREHDDWKDLLSYVKEETERLVKANDLAQMVADSDEYNNMHRNIRWNFWRYIENYKDANSPMVLFCNEAVQIEQKIKSLGTAHDALRALSSRFEIMLGTAKPRFDLTNRFMEVIARYPMLSFDSSWGTPSNENIRKAINYVNFVDVTHTFYNLRMSDSE